VLTERSSTPPASASPSIVATGPSRRPRTDHDVASATSPVTVTVSTVVVRSGTGEPACDRVLPTHGDREQGDREAGRRSG
jgi:hypothetical protein